MSITTWILFGIVNGLILYAFEKNKQNTSPLLAMALGIAGALSGGTVAYIIFGGGASGLNTTLLLAIIFEILLFGTLLLSGKSLRKI